MIRIECGFGHSGGGFGNDDWADQFRVEYNMRLSLYGRTHR
jgi:hypothetical protein